MELLPDQKNSRLTAVLLLAISVIVVYMLGFHWFIMKHRDFAVELGELRDQLTRFETVAALRDSAELHLQAIRDSQSVRALENQYRYRRRQPGTGNDHLLP